MLHLLKEHKQQRYYGYGSNYSGFTVFLIFMVLLSFFFNDPMVMPQNFYYYHSKCHGYHGVTKFPITVSLYNWNKIYCGSISSCLACQLLTTHSCMCRTQHYSNLTFSIMVRQVFTCILKKCSERRKYCMLAVVRRSQKILPCCRPPSWGHRMAKI